MKAKNFPERKRQRQLGALERLEAQQTKLGDYPYSLALVHFNEARRGEMEILESRTATNRRGERSKKLRGVKRSQ